MEPDNLSALLDLTDESILRNLESRYNQGIIYTNSGLVLISVNPFGETGIYGPNVMEAYAHRDSSRPAPHIYDIPETALRDLSLCPHQTIIISGESGSGKTENAKHILEYLTRGNTGQLASRILGANVVLEAFGNAQTQRNNNSSRFGKQISLLLQEGEIHGAQINTYLLERSRVTKHDKGEKNFHIFYQFCAHHNLYFKTDYLSGEWCAQDALAYQRIIEEFKNLDVGSINPIEDILLAILLLGTIQFVEIDDKTELVDNFIDIRKDNEIEEKYSAVDKIVDILRIKKEEFIDYLIKKNITVNSEKIQSFNTVERAITLRDGIATQLYTSLFDIIVNRINKQISGSIKPDTDIFYQSISILDIYGFEIFRENGFDQFCINWANEKIQNEFIRRVFEDKQRIYAEEGLEWVPVEFESNSECIGLIENRHGIADIVEDESISPWGSVKNLKLKIEAAHKTNNYLVMHGRNDSIAIQHYAGLVKYNLETFLSKNKEGDGSALLQNSKNPLAVSQRKKGKGGLISHFKKSLHSLFEKISTSRTHYVRCIKPNNQNEPWLFDTKYVHGQLRANGILETIRVSKQGHPHEMDFDVFDSRYQCIDISCDALIEEGILKGKTRIFLNNESLNKLEKKRSEVMKHNREVIKGVLEAYCKKRSRSKAIISKVIKFLIDKRKKEAMMLNKKINEEENNSEGKKEIREEYLNIGLNDNLDISMKNENSNISNPSFEYIDNNAILKDEITLNKIEQNFVDTLEIIKEKAHCSSEKDCLGCKNLEIKYKIQTEALKNKLMLDNENKKLQERIEILENQLKEKKQIINNLKGINTPQSVSIPPLSNIYDIISSLVSIFIKYAPCFNTEFIPRDEAMAFSNTIFQVSLKIEARGREFFEINNLFISEVKEQLPLFEKDLFKTGFILSNIIEYSRIIKIESESVNLFINNLFAHFGKLMKLKIMEFLPGAIIEYQGLKGFECKGRSYFKKIFAYRGKTIHNFIHCLDYLYNLMLFYHLPSEFITEMLNYLLKIVDYVCFNGIMIKTNFLSFNRGAQINNNLNELEKWLREIEYFEGILNLGRIRSVVKMINLVNAGVGMEHIIDNCVFLNNWQIEELICKFDIGELELTGLERNKRRIGLGGDIFLEEPSIYVPSKCEKSEAKFCVPRYMPAKYISSIIEYI
ncbi:Myosin-3 [Astathelohania contejeani]|uniref:Myosin-3 n=1 Tax=Astathelohania contejeani TaxID=164912 RepID=A0ABQ7HWY1_9MICR|nr:Myosin-3 [Thelohania contejeani]